MSDELLPNGYYRDKNGLLKEINETNLPSAPIDYSPDAVKKLCYESLVDMVHKAKGDYKALPALREVLDRLEGKPVQRNLNADASGGDVAKRLDAAIAREKALKLNVVPQ